MEQPRPREGGQGQTLLLEVVVLLVLVVWMYLNASAGSGGGLFSNGGLFAAQPRPGSAREFLAHQRLTIAAVGLPVLVLGVAVWRRRWVLAAVHLASALAMLRVAAALAP